MRIQSLPLLMLFATLFAAPSFATIVSPCESVRNAVQAHQEAAWIRQCASAQRRRDAAADAESNCRRWLESCRRAPPTRPGFMTF
jgi:hypothetical protein